MLRPVFRTVTALALVALMGSPAAAQDDEGVSTSALLIPQGMASMADMSLVNIGVRRGVREVEGVTYVHPVDRASAGYNEDVTEWVDELDHIAEMVRGDEAAEGAALADQAIEVFEDNLRYVRRSQLIDAYMSAAVGRCRSRRRHPCRSLIQRIVTFREGHSYDSDRYGPETASTFEVQRVRALSGARGTLVVETIPEGTEVYIDGRSYGPSPVTAVGLLAGDHYITVKELGFDELNARATLRGVRETTVEYELVENSDAMSVLNLQGPITDELGGERSGQNINSLMSSLGTSQMIVGLVQPNEEGDLHVHLYLYHAHTRLLQNHVEGTLTRNEEGSETARLLAISLYDGVDLNGGIDAPDDSSDLPERQPELYEQWWFWLTVIGGAGVIAGAVGAGVAASGGDQVPGGFIRIQGVLP